jgi:prepilin-type N-terminal cleavage/methylation domain-containing protein
MRRTSAAISRRLGLTLIEILVVLAIIVILMSIILTVYTGVVRWSKHKVTAAAGIRDYPNPIS